MEPAVAVVASPSPADSSEVGGARSRRDRGRTVSYRRLEPGPAASTQPDCFQHPPRHAPQRQLHPRAGPAHGLGGSPPSAASTDSGRARTSPLARAASPPPPPQHAQGLRVQDPSHSAHTLDRVVLISDRKPLWCRGFATSHLRQNDVLHWSPCIFDSVVFGMDRGRVRAPRVLIVRSLRSAPAHRPAANPSAPPSHDHVGFQGLLDISRIPCVVRSGDDSFPRNRITGGTLCFCAVQQPGSMTSEPPDAPQGDQTDNL